MKTNLLILSIILCTTAISAQNILVNAGSETWVESKPINWKITNPTPTFYVQNESNLLSNNNGNNSIKLDKATSRNLVLAEAVDLSIPSIISSVTSLYDHTYNSGSGPSEIKSFTLSGSGLTSGITINVTGDYEISTLPGLNFQGLKSFTISQWNGYVQPTTIYTRLKTGLKAASYIGSLSLSSGTMTKKILLTGAVISIPQISISTNTMTGFRYIPGSGPSAQQSFVVSAKEMSNALTITAPAGFEISTETGSSFFGTSQKVLLHSNGIINPTTVYVRLKQNLMEATYAGNLTLETSNGITKLISLSGIVSVPQVLTVSTEILSDLFYTLGNGPSAQKSFTISAKGLSKALTVIAPDNFEISNEGGSSFSSNKVLILALNSGSIATTTIYVRLKAGLAKSNLYTGNLVLNSGDISKIIKLSGNVITKPLIDISATALSNFSYRVGNGPSNIQTFTLSGTEMTSALTIRTPVGYEISTETGSNFSKATQLVLLHNKGVINPMVIHVRLKANLNEGTYKGNISFQTNGGISKSISLSGDVISQEELTVSTQAISDLIYTTENGPSIQKSFTLSAKGLTTGLTVSAPENFEISTIDGSLFSRNNIVIFPSNTGNISTTTIYVRLKAGLAKSNSYTGNLVINAGSMSKNIALSGSNPGTTAINISTTTISGFKYKFGNGPSSQQSFTVSGINIPSGLTINAPAEYEISTTEGAGSKGTGMLVLTASNGTVPSTIIHVRLKGGLAPKTYIGQVEVTSIGQISKTISLNGRVEISTDISSTNANQVKVYSNLKQKQIKVQGVNPNDTVELFSISGKLLKTLKASSDALEITVQNNSAYIVRINSKAYKVVL